MFFEVVVFALRYCFITQSVRMKNANIKRTFWHKDSATSGRKGDSEDSEIFHLLYETDILLMLQKVSFLHLLVYNNFFLLGEKKESVNCHK